MSLPKRSEDIQGLSKYPSVVGGKHCGTGTLLHGLGLSDNWIRCTRADTHLLRAGLGVLTKDSEPRSRYSIPAA